MTFNARRVLDDCELALEFLEQSTTDAIWRVHWFAAVALVRTVGDVLRKVDGQNPELSQIISDAYVRWKRDRDENAIFWDFIKDQRDRLIHEYDSDVHPLSSVKLAVEMNLRRLNDGSDGTGCEVVELDENMYRPMLSGRWEGEDGRDVLREAINWWMSELDNIDDRFGTRDKSLN